MAGVWVLVAGIAAVLAVWLMLALYLALGRMCSQ